MKNGLTGISFPLTVAIRFLREGKMQSVLILLGAGIGVAVLIFLSCLIESLQQSIIEQTTGSQAHIVVQMPEQSVATVYDGNFDGQQMPILRDVEKPAPRLKAIEDWSRRVDAISKISGITAVSPTVSGSGQALRGLAKRAITLRGVEPDAFDRIVSLQKRIKQGDWRVQGDGVLIGTELAKDLGLEMGDRLRVLIDDAHSTTFRVQGIFDLGSKDINQRWVIASLRQAQTLFDLEGNISLIECRVDDIFAANTIADAIKGRTGLNADSWMTLNAQIMTALQSQGSSSNMIQFFVIVAVALGISSVLVVSVVQKNKEIGILRAMGASTSQMERVFLWQGAIVGVVGASVGTVLGIGLLKLFALAPLTFTLQMPTSLIIRACLIALVTGLVAAVVPARRASKLDPAVAIRT